MSEEVGREEKQVFAAYLQKNRLKRSEQREAVVLKVYEGFKFDEIAEILDCPASTIKSRVYTGLELLKEILAPAVRGRTGALP